MQDESVQLRPRDNSILLEQKAALDALRQKQSRPAIPVPIPEPVEPKFVAKPKETLIPQVIEAKMLQEQRDREARENQQGFTPVGSENVSVPASLWSEIHGETMLKTVMELPSDNERTEQINNYVLKKMRVGRMEDTKENYEKVLGHILARNKLSMNQQKNYLVNKLSLYLYTKNNDKDDIDDLVLSILNVKRGKRNGRR